MTYAVVLILFLLMDGYSVWLSEPAPVLLSCKILLCIANPLKGLRSSGGTKCQGLCNIGLLWRPECIMSYVPHVDCQSVVSITCVILCLILRPTYVLTQAGFNGGTYGSKSNYVLLTGTVLVFFNLSILL